MHCQKRAINCLCVTCISSHICINFVSKTLPRTHSFSCHISPLFFFLWVLADSHNPLFLFLKKVKMLRPRRA
ncbi:hypothetical protein BCR41DRAFT_358840 [Lobosporangium transversale]|uniref:Uncharacterized protein n=1 Tax=Lobosporangium transversale TaxID=64571 RepID=A0A1Y2GF67_9FUNG|nr:hypothetical protein BCR41DRAFT_358840 [Lobosporangium transversale]ORZ09077.1 hypothetical protein BCR41DRAFT_358840 [Lobosporangium transversale]|eukprot:XP_021878704.1 hypothetical protein BCR41DRAFT_358840 [Lobosporangium transversale]